MVCRGVPSPPKIKLVGKFPSTQLPTAVSHPSLHRCAFAVRGVHLKRTSHFPESAINEAEMESQNLSLYFE